MKKYEYLISRDYTHSKVIEVEAETEEEAKELALERISDEALTMDEMVPDSDDAELLVDGRRYSTKGES